MARYPNSEAYGIFPVGVIGRNLDVEHNMTTFSKLSFHTLVGKASTQNSS